MILKNDRKDLVLEKFSDHLRFPSNIAIVGKDDILFAEKKTGMIHRIVDGHMLPEPALDVNVATSGERGVLGMAVSKNDTNNSTYVFLYYTQSTAEDGDDVAGYREPLGNRLYKYELIDNKLVNPKLLIDLPAGPPNVYNGGKVIIGPDKNVYVLVSNVGHLAGARIGDQAKDNTVINPRGGQINLTNRSDRMIQPPDDTSKIIRITQDGKPLPVNMQGNGRNMSVNTLGGKYFTYNIKNSFGMDIDPVTRTIWTAGDEEYGNKTNIIKSGALPISNSKQTYIGILNDKNVNGIDTMKNNFHKLTWNKNLGPTAISIVNSSRLGKQYENDFFVGDMYNGSLYHFDLNKDRTDLLLNGSLVDKVVNTDKEIKSQILLTGLGKITDLEAGDDGYLYFSTIGMAPELEQKFPSADGAVYRLKALGK